MIRLNDLYAQYLGMRAEIDAAIDEVIRRSAFIGGYAVEEFEQAFADYQQAGHCVGVANGTDALEIALAALDLRPGSEVIVPANAFIASSEAVTRAGLRVVFADVDPGTFTLDIADVRRRIRPQTSAIIAVHLYGHPCVMDELCTLAAEHGLRVVEDCAQAHGAEYRDRRVGAIADIGTFSFYPAKNLGAYGDGGAIVTEDGHLARRCRMIANHGRIAKYDHLFEGRNSRLDGIQAAILTVKLRYLDGWIEARNENAQRYLEGLRECADLVLPSIGRSVRHAFHLFVVRSPFRTALAEHLAAAGVQTGIHYPVALPKSPAYSYLGQADDPMRANTMDGQLLSLPVGEHLTPDQIDAVIGAIRRFDAPR